MFNYQQGHSDLGCNKTGLPPVEQVPLYRGWMQSPFGATAKQTDGQTERQTDRTCGECVQTPYGAKAEQTVRQTDRQTNMFL